MTEFGHELTLVDHEITLDGDQTANVHGVSYEVVEAFVRVDYPVIQPTRVLRLKFVSAPMLATRLTSIIASRYALANARSLLLFIVGVNASMAYR